MVLWHDLAKRAAIASLAALAACSSFVNGNGVYYEESRQVAPFVGLSVDLGIQATATVEAGSVQSVRLTGDSNLVQHIETKVVNGVLVTSTALDGFDPALPLRLYLTVPDLQEASAVGGSHVEISGAAATIPFAAGAFDGSEIHLAGAGGPSVEVALGGNSHVDATAYPAAGATVALGGASAAELRVSGTVTGDLRGGSTLQIYGGGSCAAVNVDETSNCSPP